MTSSTPPCETLPGCLRQLAAAASAGIAVGWAADLLLGDPRRGHPVALFGRAAAALERLTYADSRGAGVLHTGVLLAGLGAMGVAVERAAARRGAGGTASATAAAMFVALGGTSLARTGEKMATLLDAGATLTRPDACCRRCVGVTPRCSTARA